MPHNFPKINVQIYADGKLDEFVTLIFSGFRYAFRIVLVLWILASVPGWGLDDKIVFLS